MINQQRIADEFFCLASIDSPSYQEASIAAYLQQRFSVSVQHRIGDPMSRDAFRHP